MFRTPIIRAVLTSLLLGSLAWAARVVPMPEFSGIDRWFNTPEPLTRERLRGKVVLVDFWTYSCINCIRSIPYLKKWHELYKNKGLVIIGVHTPEFHFEKKAENVEAAIQKFDLTYPIAMDNAYKTWDAYASRSWPSDFLIDRNGTVHYSHFGEANFAEIEGQIQKLLKEKVSDVPTILPITPDFTKIRTPEIFFGYGRLSKIANSERLKPDNVHQFKTPKKLPLHFFSLDGKWRLEREFVELIDGPGKVSVRFHAAKINLVMASASGTPVQAMVYLNGKSVTEKTRGHDVLLKDGMGIIAIQQPRMYSVAQDDYKDTIVEIQFRTPGVRLYTVTFG